MRESNVLLQAAVPAQAREKIKGLAKAEGLQSVSELIRQLLSNYCTANGVAVDLNPGSWGGGQRNEPQIADAQEERDARSRPVEVWIDHDDVYVRLADGRVIGNPLAWHPWLAEATPAVWANYELDDYAVYWFDLDEGLDIEGMLRGVNPTGQS